MLLFPKHRAENCCSDDAHTHTHTLVRCFGPCPVQCWSNQVASSSSSSSFLKEQHTAQPFRGGAHSPAGPREQFPGSRTDGSVFRSFWRGNSIKVGQIAPVCVVIGKRTLQLRENKSVNLNPSENQVGEKKSCEFSPNFLSPRKNHPALPVPVPAFPTQQLGVKVCVCVCALPYNYENAKSTYFNNKLRKKSNKK